MIDSHTWSSLITHYYFRVSYVLVAVLYTGHLWIGVLSGIETETHFDINTFVDNELSFRIVYFIKKTGENF